MGVGDTIAFLGMMAGFMGALAMLLEGYKSRMRVKERELELRIAQAKAPATEGSEGADRIEARLRVLERIATDPTAKLSDEIEALRLLDQRVS